MKLDEQSFAKFKRNLDLYSKKKGQLVEGSIDELAGHAGKALAGRIQPFGLSARKMKKFEQSVKAQVHRSLKNANIEGGSQSAAEAHRSRRDGRGQVPKGMRTHGQYNRSPISKFDRFRRAEIKADNVGTAKGAWLDAARKSWKGVRFAKYFNSKLANGSVSKRGRGMKRQVTLTNNLPYIQKIMKKSDITRSVQQAFKGMKRKMQRELDKP